MQGIAAGAAGERNQVALQQQIMAFGILAAADGAIFCRRDGFGGMADDVGEKRVDAFHGAEPGGGVGGGDGFHDSGLSRGCFYTSIHAEPVPISGINVKSL